MHDLFVWATKELLQLTGGPGFYPALSLAVAADGPLPVLPTETVAIFAAARAAAGHEVGHLVLLWVVMVLGSVLGDLFIFSLARSSAGVRLFRRVLAGAGPVESAVRRRPLATLLTMRLLPAGRLVSVFYCGHLRLHWRQFLVGSGISSALWSAYICGIGVVLGPVVGKNVWISVLAAVAVSILMALGFAARAAWAARRRQAGPPGRSTQRDASDEPRAAA